MRKKEEKRKHKHKELGFVIGAVLIAVIVVSVAALYQRMNREQIEQEDEQKNTTLSSLWFNMIRPNIANNDDLVADDDRYVPYEMVEEIFPDMSYEEKIRTPYPVGEVESFFRNHVTYENSEPGYLSQRIIVGDTIPYDGQERSITCWGDSMTEGNGASPATINMNGEQEDISYSTFPSVLEQLSGITTYNLGVGGETSIQIAQRQGGLKMITDRNLNIPTSGAVKLNLLSEEYGVPIDINDYSGYGMTQDRRVNKVYINNKLYKLTFNGDSHMVYKKLNHKLKSSSQTSAKETMTNGMSSVFVPAGTQVYTAASVERKNDILIIEMGSNGGWDDFDELISQYDAMISYADCSYYIILGDTDDPDYVAGLGDTPWEASLREAYGDHFINMRTYLIENGLNDCGLTASYADMECYYNGQISKQLRADWTHLNSYGYYSKGIAVYNKGVELGYWD